MSASASFSSSGSEVILSAVMQFQPGSLFRMARVAGETRRGADAEPVGDPGPEPLQERVGVGHETQHRLDPVGVLQVDADRTSVAVQDRHAARVEATVDGLDAVDPQDLGAHVGEQHRRERPRADPDELDDLHPCQRPGHGPSLTSASH